MFPDAIPGQELLHSTPSETTPSLPSTGGGERDPSVQYISSEPRYMYESLSAGCLTVFMSVVVQGEGVSQTQTSRSVADPHKACGDASRDRIT